MKIFIEYMPPNWNDYVYAERTSKYIANKIKQDEKRIVQLLTRGKKYTGNYPIEVIVRPHYNAYRQDLDNCRYKGLLDGLVSAGVLKSDNLKHIQKITLEPIFDDKVGIEFEIKEIEK
jgi:Holliday junction resolvase RusA-like endonuclease